MKPLFSSSVLDWFDLHGRKNLPWQRVKSVYNVWISEIMLQQTQVATVIPYYQRFMQSFPDVSALADASLDDVLSHWAGLGYYARARNLHRAAQMIRDDYALEFPRDIDHVIDLPGIGKSTAGAILSLALNQKHAILDGNVKRVLARYHRIEGWAGHTRVLNQYWQYAERYTPLNRVADYNQAMMDLGSMVCTRSQPQCERCPLNRSCEAHRYQQESSFPLPRPKKPQLIKQTKMLMLCNEQNNVLIQQRPPVGIWGGLWSLPECAPDEDIYAFVETHFGQKIKTITEWETVRHTFSHFHLDITPIKAVVDDPVSRVMEADASVWYNTEPTKKKQHRGFAAPVKRLLERLEMQFQDQSQNEIRREYE